MPQEQTRRARIRAALQIVWFRFMHFFGLDSCPVEPPRHEKHRPRSGRG